MYGDATISQRTPFKHPPHVTSERVFIAYLVGKLGSKTSPSLIAYPHFRGEGICLMGQESRPLLHMAL